MPGVPIKTAAGQAELGTRRLRLSQRHRTVLFLVDGRRTEAQVRDLAAQAGVPGTCFDELLGLSLIALPELPPAPVAPTVAPAVAPAVPAALEAPAPVSTLPQDSLLPAAGTLPPDSSALDSVPGGAPSSDSWLPPESDEDDAEPADAAFDQARDMLLRAVRTEAPVAGSLTLLRLRRARSRADLDVLLDEVEARISKPHRSLAATQTLRSVRQLLARDIDTTPSAA
ncbi:MAG TPA: hypothetical protein VF319_12785 [Caldimonas sp.]